MRAFVVLALACGIAGCQVDEGAESGEIRASNRFLDGTPGTPRSVLETQGFAYFDGAFVREKPMCDKQTVGPSGSVAVVMLKNKTTGQKALCCSYARTRTTWDNSSCKIVDSSFAIGPDLFSGRMLE